jgi:endonuclease/exonuclease/phosphatase family metal-dependent hydrolase
MGDATAPPPSTRTPRSRHGPTSSWNAFKAIEPGRRIDFILVRPPVRVRQHGILSDTFDGRFPSDHLPVLAELSIP